MATRTATLKKMKNQTDLENALKSIAQMKREVDKIDMKAQEKSEAILQAAAEKSRPLADTILRIEERVIEYVEKNRSRIFTGDTKSKKLTFATIGFRSSMILFVSDARFTIEKIRRLFEDRSADAIIVKETINKDVLKKWHQDDIKIVGAKLVAKETFYYELNQPEVTV